MTLAAAHSWNIGSARGASRRRLGRRVRWPTLSALVILGATTVSVRAQSLQVDPAFAPRLTRLTAASFVAPHGVDGLLVYARDLAETAGQPSGHLVRFGRDGSFDPSFRFAELKVEAGLTDMSFAVLQNGKILAFRNPSNGNLLSSFVRYHTDGSLDPSFRTTYAPSGDFIGPWTVDASGRICAEARYPEGWGLYRLNPGGGFDSSFRTVFNGEGSAISLVPLANGRSLATGTFRAVNGVPLQDNPGFVRLAADGAIDAGFTYAGPGQYVSLIAVLMDGRLLAAVATGGSSVIRMSDNGAVDAGFALADAETFTIDRGRALPDGRVVVAIRRPAPTAGQSRYAIRHHRADGSLQVEQPTPFPLTLLAILPDFTAIAGDNLGHTYSVGPDGRMTPNPFPLRAAASPDHMMPLRDGGVLMAPVLLSILGPSLRYDMVNGAPRNGLVRLKPDGSVDPAFRPPEFDPRVRELFTFAEDSQGRLLLGILSTFVGESVLVRLLPDGAPDEGFNLNSRALGDIAGALPLPGGEILVVRLDGRFAVASSEGRLVRTLPIELDRSIDIALQPTAGGRIAVSGFFSTLNGAVLPVRFFRLNPDLTLDSSFQIPAADNPRPADLRQARIAPLPDGGLVAYGVDTAAPLFVQRFAADGSRVRSFSAAPTFGTLFTKLLGRPDGTIVTLEHRTTDSAQRLRLLREDGSRITATDLDVQGIGEYQLMNGSGGAVFVAGIESIGYQPRFGLARLVPGEPGADGNLARLVNVSANVAVGPDELQAIAGFVVQGENRPVLVRGVGPGLAGFGVTNALVSPQLRLFAGSMLVGLSQGWGGSYLLRDAFLRVGAFALPENGADAALLTLVRGATTAVLGPADGASRGFGLIEVYDATDDGLPAIRNLSVRAEAGRDNAAMIVGFVVRGEGEVRVLVRAIGPTLAQHGVTTALADPRLRLFKQPDTRMPQAENDNWADDPPAAVEIRAAAARAGAFPLLAGSRDAALVTAVAAGAYTAVLTSSDGSAGVALIEVYLLDD